MSFISPEYVIFFTVVISLYFSLRHGWRWPMLLIASYVFYAYGILRYLPLLIFSTVVDYITGRLIPQREGKFWRLGWLTVSLTVNLGVLFTYKYLDFFNGALGAVLGYQAQPLGLVLPIGISFYTFQSMSYTIDIYRGHLKPEKNLGIMATFVSFFPQLVAGPIERATNLLPQFYERHTFDAVRVVEGFRLILWGFFKKVVIGDRLAMYVNVVYNDVNGQTGATLWLATFFFAFQIYCDFSAYSDIAIGTARVMGFRLMDNFNQPYLSASVREFWARWHISLSTWFRDYLYVPLGGNRRGIVRTMVNLFVVFLVSGLWHGAGWTFIIWGALHGVAMAILTLMRHRNIQLIPDQRGGRLFKILLTFAFVNFAWIFFRANSLDDAVYVINHLTVFNPAADLSAPFAEGLLGAQTELVLSFCLIALLLGVDWWIMRARSVYEWFGSMPTPVRWVVYYAMGAAVMFSGLYGTGAQQFIYFQF
jgi:D-alanyl-lipoteichoic acid acyltransferase DltB (MBOAT superfamily)